MIHIQSLSEKDTFIYSADNTVAGYTVPQNRRQMIKRIKWAHPFLAVKYSAACLAAGAGLCGGLYGLNIVVAKISVVILG